MESLEPKKLLLLRILQVLEEHSSADHPLRQKDIIRLLHNEYDMDCERKAVGRNLAFLEQAGYDVVHNEQGVYLGTRTFEAGELRLLSDAVLCSRHICAKHTKDLVDKLTALGGRDYRAYRPNVVRLDDWQKTSNQDLLYNVEILCEAIAAGKQVRYVYYHYGVDKKRHATGRVKTVNPYQVFCKNGFYYLACSFEPYRDQTFCRVDRIGEIELLDTRVEMPKEGTLRFSAGQSFNRLPYLFEEEPTLVTFEASKYMADHVIDWFGFDFAVTPQSDDVYRYTVRVGEKAMLYWALQFATAVRVVAPQTLVTTIRDTLSQMGAMYAEGD